MTAINYIAHVDARGALALPKEAQDVLQLQPGEEVRVSVDRIQKTTQAPNAKMLAILQDIQERHKDRVFTDPSDTDQLLREARAGAMYADERTR